MKVSVIQDQQNGNLNVRSWLWSNRYIVTWDTNQGGGLKIKLKPGLKVLLDDDEGLATDGVVEFSAKENIWVAKFDWGKLNKIFPNKG